MARKTKEVTISADGGRDAGRIYVLTELPASQAEKWAAKVWLALSRSGGTFHVSEEEISSGLAGVAAALMRQGFNLFAHMRWEEAEPLMDEMWACIKIKDHFENGAPNIRSLYEQDVEEIATRVLLRKEVMNLHIDFFEFAGKLKSILAKAMGITSAIQTSPRQ